MGVGGQSGARRSERVLVDVPLLIRGGSGAGQVRFEEETFTVTVNAHGALVMLAAQVSIGEPITVSKLLDDPKERRECHVAYVGPRHAGLAQVGMEFCEPAPGFWPIEAPASRKPC
jgi:hypothetical protein